MEEVSGVDASLNDVLVAAVNAKVEASVLEALSGDETIGRLVTAALTQEVTVKNGYRDEKTPFITQVIRKTLQETVKTSVGKVMEEERPRIEHAVREAILARLDNIAETMVSSAVESSKNGYSVNVDFKVRGRDY